MKRIISFCAAILMSVTVFAQSPNKMSYQAVIRNTSNSLVTNSTVGIRISILQTSSSGTAVYVETQSPTTNANGLVSIEIGGGTVVSGNFANINWANGPYFVKTETDPTGGTNYSILGISQLLSVPYALYAKTAENVSGIDGSETKITAGTNVTITGIGTTASPYVINASTGSSLQKDLLFPDGFENITPITLDVNNTTGYTVPSGKNLYITNVFLDNGQISIDYKMIISSSFNTQNAFPNFTLSNPIIVGQGEIVRGLSYNSGNPSTARINGFLVDAIITPITLDVNNTTGYTVPSGKNLYITNVFLDNGQISIDYKMIISSSFNTQNAFPNFTLSNPIIVGQGEIVRGLSYNSGNPSTARINGYLR